MGLFPCDGTCATAEALRSEVGYLRELLDRYAPKPAEPSLLTFGQEKKSEEQPQEGQPQKKRPSPFASRTISSHPRVLAQLRELEDQNKGKL